MLSEYLADDDFSRIFVLNGYAGTGKTTLIAALVGALKALGIKPVLLAPTAVPPRCCRNTPRSRP